MGYKIDVFTRRDDPSLPAISEIEKGLRVIHVDAGPPRFVPKEDMLPMMNEFTRWMIDFLLDRRDYDLVHANFFMSGLVGARLKRAFGLPLVVTFHALGRVRLMHQRDADGFPARRLEIEKQVMNDADAIIAECPQDRRDQETLYGVDADKIRMAPCGFDGDELAPVERFAARRRLGLDATERVVLHVGRMVPRKGVDTAIEGFARLVLGHGIPARMLIAGGESDEPDPAVTPEIGRLMEVARREGVADRVRFTGRLRRQALRYYDSAADVFVTTPWYEPFGITPLEAMACGTPVVGSAVGGIQYTVEHGGTGFLVPPHDADAVGARLAELLRQPRLMYGMRRAAIARVNKLFTWGRVAQLVARIYEEVLPRSAASALAAGVASNSGPVPQRRRRTPVARVSVVRHHHLP